MKKVIINAKGSALLRDAIRIAAFKYSNSNKSKLIIDILEKDPSIVTELQKLRKNYYKKSLNS